MDANDQLKKIPGSRLMLFGASLMLLGSICMGVLILYLLYLAFSI